MGLIVIVVFLEKQVVSPLMFSAGLFMCMFSTGLTTPFMRVMFAKYGDDLKDGGKGGAVLGGEAPVVTTSAAPAASPVLATLVFDDARIGTTKIRSARSTIGRDQEDTIRIADVRVSRNHALLTLGYQGKFEIHNLTADRSEPNPIAVNGVDKASSVLADGDTVSLGGIAFTFRQPDAKVAR
jgi:hypothetical protein